MKEFFKPTRGKIILTVVLVIMFFFLQGLINTFFPTFDVPQKFGLPFTFLETGCYMPGPYSRETNCVNNFYLGPFIVDLLFWGAVSYLISSLIMRKKKHPPRYQL